MEEAFEGEPSGIGGHDFVFIDELSPGQTCSICLLAMRSPVQTACGHRFCESCLLETFRERHDQVCPQDRNPIPDLKGYGGSQFFPDVAWEREILSLRVKCKRSERGCDWTGQLRHYEEHLNLCEYEDVTCDDCDQEMHRRLLHKHTTSECRNRVVECEYCEEEFAFWATEHHKDYECTRFPLDCPQECGVQEIPREEVEFHVRDDCMMTMVHCPYEGAGCTFHDKRSSLDDHLETSSEQHLRKTWSKLLKTTERLNELEAVEGQIEELQTDKESMKRLLDGNSEEISDLKLSAKKLELENMALKKDVAALQKQVEEVKLTVAGDKKEIRSTNAEYYKTPAKDVAEPQCSNDAYPCKDVVQSKQKIIGISWCEEKAPRKIYDDDCMVEKIPNQAASVQPELWSCSKTRSGDVSPNTSMNYERNVPCAAAQEPLGSVYTGVYAKGAIPSRKTVPGKASSLKRK